MIFFKQFLDVQIFISINKKFLNNRIFILFLDGKFKFINKIIKISQIIFQIYQYQYLLNPNI